MEEELNLEKQILYELADVIGIDKSVIIDYAKYCELKSTGSLVDLGNCNFMIKTTKNYLDQSRITGALTSILLHHFEDLKIYELTQKDLRHLQKIDANFIIIDTINNVNLMVYTIDALLEFISANPDKIFVMVYSEPEDTIKQNRNIASVFSDYFSWSIEVVEATPDEKSKYIKEKLQKNHIKVSRNCELIEKLMQEDMSVIDNELLYLAVKFKANKVGTITDDFLQKVNRPQYISAPRLKEKSAMQELDEMIGLESVKQQIKQIVFYVRTSKNRNQIPMLHFAFLGNSGCGKTEVARLVCRIFAEEGILPSNEFIEAQRCDLIAGYIGQTSLKTQAVINKALGSTLYIDEAYAIAPTSQRDFGNECIATLIKAMEDHRDKLSVILSGYTDDMEELLKSNRGFSSRVPFKIYFPDYTSEELYLIFRKMIKEDGYKLDKGVKQLLLVHFEKARKQSNFGNGRYVRNLLDKIKFTQTDRITTEENADINLITKLDVKNVITVLEEQQPKIKRQIGFTTT